MTPFPPPRDPRTIRHSTRVMVRARELVDAGWTAGETRKRLARELGLDPVPSETTIRSWTEPGYRERHREWQRKCASQPGTPDVLLALRQEDGLTYAAIAAVAKRFLGEEFSPDQIRHRLYAMGVEKNPNKVRSGRRLNANRRLAA